MLKPLFHVRAPGRGATQHLDPRSQRRQLCSVSDPDRSTGSRTASARGRSRGHCIDAARHGADVATASESKAHAIRLLGRFKEALARKRSEGQRLGRPKGSLSKITKLTSKEV